MAGIGFSLRALAGQGGYVGMLRLYGAAGLISCGPWLLSVFALLFIGVVGKLLSGDTDSVARFQVCVTWLLATSLVLSGPLQLHLTRFVSDLCYAQRNQEVASNLFGSMALATSLGLCVAAGVWPLFNSESLALKVLLATAFVALLNSWLVMSVLTGLRQHRPVLASFGGGYLVTVVLCVAALDWGEEGLLFGFAAGQVCLLLFGLRAILLELPLHRPLAFQFLRRRFLRPALLLVGLTYNLGIWIDKLVFWFGEHTGRSVLGPLRASDVYDLPVFLAYLTLIPGMAVFLVKVETDFAERHAAFYGAIRKGRPLSEIESLRDRMTASVRTALIDIGKVQFVSFLACLWWGPQVFDTLSLSRLHLPLFYIDAFGAALQVLLLAITSVFFYLDRGSTVAKLSAMFLVVNGVGTLVTHSMGPTFYGIGFGFAAAVTSIVALGLLDRKLRTLVRDTFMLQPLGGS